MLQTNVRGPLTLAGIVIGLSLLIGIGGSYLLAGMLGDRAAEVAAARVASARAATLAPRIAALKAQEASAAAYERVISLFLPTQEQLLEVPRSVEQLGRTHEVDARFQFLGSPEAGAPKIGASLPFSLTVSGAADRITAFLTDFELRNPRYTVSLGAVDFTVNDPATAKAVVAGNVYYQ